jgi:uncharacterized protein YkwD
MAPARMLVAAMGMTVALVVPAAPASAASPAAKMIRKVNVYRQHHGLARLHMSRSLNHSSHSYAGHMMRSGYFGHAGRIRASGHFKRLGEIIEMHRGSRSDMAGALRAWINSPGHNAILLDGNFSYVGAGKVSGRFHGRRTTMWVMHFGHT